MVSAPQSPAPPLGLHLSGLRPELVPLYGSQAPSLAPQHSTPYLVLCCCFPSPDIETKGHPCSQWEPGDSNCDRTKWDNKAAYQCLL